MRPAPPSENTARPITWWVLLGLVVGVAAAYHGTWQAPFVFDDEAAILGNPTIRTLWPLTVPLAPPAGGLPVSGRPIPNLTLALNFAVSGTQPWSYHATNVALHLLAAFVLAALLRRTLRRPVMPERMRAAAPELAATVAVVWALHPLATAAVTYTTQRTEVLASLFLLLTVYAFARAADGAGRSTLWAVVAGVACLLGMASKETMAAAPLLVLLYDRTFFAGSFSAPWRQSWKLHASLMATWALLAGLALGATTRGGTAGFGIGITPLDYALTQTEAITRYLGLALWPYPLVFDYGVPLTSDWKVFVPLGLFVSTLLALTIFGIVRRPVLAFPAAVFFAVLAPSSSLVPVATQTMGEHRMYLPLAAVLTVAIIGLHAWLGRRAFFLLGAAACALGVATHARNADYASAERLWRDTVEKRPDNARAHNNLATLLLERGDFAGGVSALERALALRPDYADAHRNLAQALLLAGRVSEALAPAREAQRLDPDSPAGRLLLGQVLLFDGRAAEALPHFDAVLALQPPSAPVLTSRALALLDLGRIDEARTALREALRLDPAHATARRVLEGLP